MGGLAWRSAGPGMGLSVEWRSGSPPLMVFDNKTLSDLGVACYRSADDSVVTSAIGSMATGLHPFLALWAVLLALSSLARYEPAIWSKMIDIDRSAEANAIEHLLEEAAASVPLRCFICLTPSADRSARPETARTRAGSTRRRRDRAKNASRSVLPA